MESKWNLIVVFYESIHGVRQVYQKFSCIAIFYRIMNRMVSPKSFVEKDSLGHTWENV